MKPLLFALFVLVVPGVLPAQPAYKEIAVTNGGTIEGTVRLTGPVPKGSRMEITKNPAECGSAKPSPRLELGKDNCVSNAVVFLEGITSGKTFNRDVTCTVTQKKCEYNPHITIVPRGAHLEIVNGDPILHNVHAYDDMNGERTAFNIAQPIRNQKSTVKETVFEKCGTLISLTCDAGHPWMSGYIFSTSNPYYAVTDKKGRFSLSDVPPGTYRLMMWHEGVSVARSETENGKVKKYLFEEPYTIERSVTLAPGGTENVNFEFSLR